MRRLLYIFILSILITLLGQSDALAFQKGEKKKPTESSVVKEKEVLDSVPNKDVSKTIDDTLVYDDYEVPSANDRDTQYAVLQKLPTQIDEVREQQEGESETYSETTTPIQETEKTWLDMPAEPTVHVYPNPVVHGQPLNVTAPEGALLTIQTLSGKLLAHQILAGSPAQFTPEAAGLYFVHIRHDGQEKTVRVLVK